MQYTTYVNTLDGLVCVNLLSETFERERGAHGANVCVCV